MSGFGPAGRGRSCSSTSSASKQRRLTLGPVTALDLGKARDAAKDLYAKVRLGGDPAGEKVQARLKAGETFEATAAHYLRHQQAKLRPRSYAQVHRHLNLYARPLHRLGLEKVTKRDIAACIASVRTNSGLVTGNRARATLSAFFTWAMGEGLVEANPVIGTNRSEEKSRERVLDSAELRLIWNALRDDDTRRHLKLLMLTGQRAGEIAGLRWSEIRDDAIVLPGERTKNHRPHTIPLSRAALDIITKQQRREGRDLIFGRAGPVQRVALRHGGAEQAYCRSCRAKPAALDAARSAPQLRDPRRRDRHPAAHHRSVPEPRLRAQGRCRRHLQQSNI